MSTEPQAASAAEEPAATPAPVPTLEPVQALETVDHDSLVAALAAAQAQFPAIPKRHTATVHGKDGKAGYNYSYADLGDVLAATRPILAAHGLVFTQATAYTEAGRLMLVSELEHVSGQKKISELLLEANPGNPQQFGGALTYLRRYQAVTLLGVAAEQDLDAADVEPIRPGQAPPPELPPWAKPAGGGKRLELIEVLERIVGRERAVRFVDNTASNYGYLPAAVATAVRSFARATIDELDPLAFDDAEAKRVAAAAAAAQDAAAEAPDSPAPAPAGDEPSPEEIAEARELAAAEDAALEAGVDVSLEPDVELAPGTVQAPDIATAANASPLKRIEVLRAAGCICPQPVATDEHPASLLDACPIIGHGIPF